MLQADSKSLNLCFYPIADCFLSLSNKCSICLWHDDQDCPNISKICSVLESSISIKFSIKIRCSPSFRDFPQTQNFSCKQPEHCAIVSSDGKQEATERDQSSQHFLDRQLGLCQTMFGLGHLRVPTISCQLSSCLKEAATSQQLKVRLSKPICQQVPQPAS